jgi:hypothetical protein
VNVRWRQLAWLSIAELLALSLSSSSEPDPKWGRAFYLKQVVRLNV